MLFDLTTKDIADVQIKKGVSSQCYITDGANFYSGFILCNKKDTQTTCDVAFYPSSKSGLYIPRLTFSKIKLSTGEPKAALKPDKVRIAFDGSDEGIDEFWRMIGFLSSFKDLVDLGAFKSRYKIVGIEDVVIQLKDLEEAERVKELLEYARRSGVDLTDLAQSAMFKQREKILKRFKLLLDEPATIQMYESKFKTEMNGNGEEAVWHHFLKTNNWLLGLNLDIRFVQDFVDEVSTGNPDTANRNNPKVDMLGYSDYTVLVELKTPNTEIFTPKKTTHARAGTWSFSSPFIEGFSQCLAQKSAWDRESRGKDLMKDGKVINQNMIRTVDTKAVFVIGNKQKELPMESADKEIIVQRDTFERFRRSNRIVEIITYDELYNRASYVVHGKML